MQLTRRDLIRAAALVLGAGGAAGALGACGAGAVSPDVLAGDAERADPTDLGPVPAAVSAFSARLLQAAADPAANSVCSPLSAAVALSMTRLGAAGATADEVEAVLGASDATVRRTTGTAGSPEAWHEGMNTLAQELASRSGVVDEQDSFVPLAPGEEPRRGPEAVLLDLSSTVFLARQLQPEPEFLDALTRWYGTPVHRVDFTGDAAEAADAVNAWAARTTHDRITGIDSEQSITTDTRLLLANAVHLRAPWAWPFNAGLTEPKPFTRADGSVVPVDTMHGLTYRWYEDEVCRATLRPYAGGQLAMAFVQPVTGIENVLAHWADGGLAELLGGFEEAEVHLAVPTWDIAWDNSLSTGLEQLGLVRLFDPGRADLHRMTVSDAPLHVDDVVQRAVITVDEDGTEAAAATAVEMGVGSAPVEPAEPHELVLDRPFLFVVVDLVTEVPLSLGVVADPSQRTRA